MKTCTNVSNVKNNVECEEEEVIYIKCKNSKKDENKFKTYKNRTERVSNVKIM